LTGGKEHHPPTWRPVVRRCKSLDEQQRRTGVDCVSQIDFVGGELLQALLAAAGVVGNNNIEPTKLFASVGHNNGWRLGLCKVKLDQLGSAADGPNLIY
jgi:hypothetical protein